MFFANLVLKYFKMPLIMILPYIFLVTTIELIFRLFNYHAPLSGGFFIDIVNKNAYIFQKPLESIAINFYQSIGKVVPSGISNGYNELINNITKNLVFNIGLSYMLYCAGFVFIFSILIRFATARNLIAKINKNKLDRAVLIEINEKMNDTAGDYYRDFAHSTDRNKLSMEIKLLLSDKYSYTILQFSFFIAISLLSIPYLTYQYVFWIAKYFNIVFLIFGIETYLLFFQIQVIMEFILLSIVLSLLLTIAFYKKNIFIYIMKNIIAENCLYLYRMDTNDTRQKDYAIKRLNEFNSNEISKLFNQKVHDNNSSI
ncbi:MAG: hypothetical protein AB7D29_06980 [Campylobacterales bacterium]